MVLGDHVGIAALLKAMTRQGKRQYVRGVSVMRTEIVFRRKANSNITVPWAVNRDSRGTVFGQPLRLESDGTEELMMPGCVSIANCQEHTADQSCRKADWVLDDFPKTSPAVPSE